MVAFPDGAVADEITEGPSYMAEKTCLGFIAHDDGRHETAVDAFFEVDRRQFPLVGDETARRGATAFVDALWAKDAVEAEHRDDPAVRRRLVDQRPVLGERGHRRRPGRHRLAVGRQRYRGPVCRLP